MAKIEKKWLQRVTLICVCPSEDTGQTLATEPAMTLVRVRVYETSKVS